MTMKAMKKVLVSALAAALVVTAAAPAGAATSPVTAPKAVNGKANQVRVLLLRLPRRVQQLLQLLSLKRLQLRLQQLSRLRV